MADHPSLSRDLIRLIRNRPIGPSDRDAAALFLLDAVANMIAGQNSPQGRKLIAWGRELSGNGPISQIDKGRQALLLGGLCHILEVDDLHRPSVVHPGCVVAPVALVLGQGLPGSHVLDALLAGFEATCRVGMAVGPGHYKIWHNTATCGPFGSVMAAAELLDLNEDQTVDAFGNAGSQSAGLWQFLDTGAETKHLHAGRGAEAGLVAAQLARLGFTGAPQILEGERGFFRATCPDPDISRLLDQPEAPWQLTQTSIKPWPSCRHTHPAIDTALKLRQQIDEVSAGWDAATVHKIEVAAYPAALALCDRPDPDSTYAGKFSLQHCVAAALDDGRVNFASFEGPSRQRLQDIRAKVSVTTAASFSTNYPVRWGSSVRIVLNDGQVFADETLDALGDPEAPLSPEQLRQKAIGLMSYAGHEGAAVTADQILAMPHGGSAPDIIGLISAT